MKLALFALAALTLMGAGNSARAVDKTFGDGSLPDFLKPFDVDGDGKLSAEERQAAKAAIREKAKASHEEFLKKWDTDGDGKLSADELKAARDAQKAKVEELRTKRFTDADKDADGQLSKAEFTATVPATHLPVGAVDLIFAHLDKDASGGISLAEFLAGCGPRPAGGGGGTPPPPPALPDWVKPYDLNNDNILQPAEWTALQADIASGKVVPPGPLPR
jgi:Ca2+-binding EF-hand superfamily protein